MFSGLNEGSAKPYERWSAAKVQHSISCCMAAYSLSAGSHREQDDVVDDNVVWIPFVLA
jgi:hypothetical protein